MPTDLGLVAGKDRLQVKQSLEGMLLGAYHRSGST